MISSFRFRATWYGNSAFIKSSSICTSPLTPIRHLSAVPAEWYIGLILMTAVVRNDLEIKDDVAPVLITLRTEGRKLNLLINTICSYHVTYEFQSESTL